MTASEELTLQEIREATEEVARAFITSTGQKMVIPQATADRLRAMHFDMSLVIESQPIPST